jgi:hypothetical protein
LAAKLQINTSPQARGLRVATVTPEGQVNSEIRWFNTAWTFSFLAPPDAIKGSIDWKLYCLVALLIANIANIVVLAVLLPRHLNQIIKMNDGTNKMNDEMNARLAVLLTKIMSKESSS